ncbi:MAG: amino acid adenylation domain-containing protein, partial [Pseudonocardiaceae bacterium]
VRVRLRPGEPVAQVLTRLQAEQAGLLAHHHLGLADIQRLAGLGQLFDTLAAYENFPSDPGGLAESVPGLRITDAEGHDATHYPLGFTVLPGERLSINLEYRSDVFDLAAAEAMAGWLVRLLEQLAADPSMRVSQIELLSPDERLRVLTTWNDTEQMMPDLTVAELLEAQVERTPDAVALVFGKVTLSFLELNARVNRLARLLIARGAGPERVVALALPRSADMVAALFAVLKTGAAYLPLDLDYPADRLEFMLTDASPVCLFATTASAVALPDVDVDRIVLDDPDVASEVNALPGDDPTDAERPGFARADRWRLEHPAYVIYTSGSTGVPRGVLATHGGMANLYGSHCHHLMVPAQAAAGGRQLRAAHIASFSFDGSWEPLLWMIGGHQLHVLDEATCRDPDGLLAYLADERIDFVDLTPTYLQELMGWGLLDPDRYCPAVIAVGGEATPARLWERLCALPASVVHDLYGPTECTVDAYGWHHDGRTSWAAPIANTCVYVLDAHLRPTPSGVPGELYLAGAGVTRGYLRRAALTATRYLPNPYGTPGTRMYRTGDLVRRRPDGVLDFLGRVDDQVKIRGFRIELGEVEAVLAQHPHVAQAAVVADDAHVSGVRRLVGYVVPAQLADVDRGRAEREQIGEWQQVYDAEYTAVPTALSAEDFSGWNSSYDGQPIPLAQMREWRETTVARIRELRPGRVLEIGVGNGLLLSQLAPDCEAYWATDFSAPVIDRLRADVAGDPGLAARVELACQPAHDIGGLPTGFFDTVIVNSVIQYFPSVGYLTEMLGKAMTLTAPGGAVFVGDVRDLRLLRCFHTAVQLARIDGSADAGRVRRMIERAVRLERELLVAPGYFAGLHERLPDVGGVDIRIKRGWSHNELTRYRYDVTVRKTPAEMMSLADAPQLVWGAQIVDVDALEAYLHGQRPDCMRVCRVPNARVAPEAAALRALDDGGPIAEVLPSLAIDGGVEPETLHEVGQRLGYRVVCTWADTVDGSYDALFVIARQTGALTGVYRPAPTARKTLDVCANDPVGAREIGALVPRLREHLQQRLPDYMVPAALVVLEALPLTINGKLDVKALPSPDPYPDTSHRAPRSPQEQILCELFAEVLGLDRVGVDDNFFTLGGDSIISIQLVSRARKAGVAICPRDVFERRTPAGLAAVAEAVVTTTVMDEPADAAPGVVPLTPAMRWLCERGSVDGLGVALVVQTPAGLSRERLVGLVQAL